MRLLGIDYGRRNVGVAISDEAARFAMPHAVLKNDQWLLKHLASMSEKLDIVKIIVGESKDFKGKDNPVMGEIRNFVEMVKKELKISVEMEPEYMTSAEAERLQGKTDLIDASAAAIILQSYINKKNSSS